MKRAERAEENFKKGLNCAQSVVLAFSDLTGMSREDLLRISAPFGGGIGRMREVCGTVSGMMIIAGLVFIMQSLRRQRKNRSCMPASRSWHHGFER